MGMKYALVLYSDGDARVHDRGTMQVGDKVASMYSDMICEVVQVSDDKDLLIKMAHLARVEYMNKFEGLDDRYPEIREHVMRSVDQTVEGQREHHEQPTN